ncbi:hypothetical protein D3C86_1431140 [compost metagenome]
MRVRSMAMSARGLASTTPSLVGALASARAASLVSEGVTTSLRPTPSTISRTRRTSASRGPIAPMASRGMRVEGMRS